MEHRGEIKIIFSGSMGAGKTTAITELSDIDVISTEAPTTDEANEIKETTTTAMDYGELDIGDDLVLRLYGTPGQERFRHMWEMLVPGALGLIILIDNSASDPLGEASMYLENFESMLESRVTVFGITKTDIADDPAITDYENLLAGHAGNHSVIKVDARNRQDVLRLMDVFLQRLEAQLV